MLLYEKDTNVVINLRRGPKTALPTEAAAITTWKVFNMDMICDHGHDIGAN